MVSALLQVKRFLTWCLILSVVIAYLPRKPLGYRHSSQGQQEPSAARKILRGASINLPVLRGGRTRVFDLELEKMLNHTQATTNMDASVIDSEAGKAVIKG